MGTFSLETENLQKIKQIFIEYPNLMTLDFENRMRQSIRVLHYQYLYSACKETQAILPKYNDNNLFELIMNIYNKKRKMHQAKFLLLHCFENALRSTLAVEIANLYNEHEDNWFLKKAGTAENEGENELLKKIARIKRKQNVFKNTFEVFDIFTLGDLQDILKIHRETIAYIFVQPKCYKNQPLPAYGKEHLMVKMSRIRNVRNETFHNKPTKLKFQKDLEILLLRLGYNLYDAINIGDIHNAIHLKYQYD